MKIDLYPSAIARGKFLAVPAGTPLQGWPAPAGFDPELIKVHPLVNTLDIQASDVGRIAMDPADVIDQINRQGWALVATTTTITVMTPPGPMP